MSSADAKPFFFPGGDRAILCVHGFTGSPYEVRFLAERLNAAGFTTLGIRLPGHPDAQELARVQYEAWRGAVASALSHLERARGVKAPVGIAGLSMGGALSLDAAARYGARIAAVAAFATPVFLAPPLERAIRISQKIRLDRLLPYVPKLAGSDIGDEEQRRKNPSMDRTPVAAVYQLCRLLDEVRAELPEVRQPLLLAHGMRDRTVPYSNLDYIASRVTSRALEVLRYPASRHVITLDIDRESLARAVVEFFVKHLGAPARAEVSLPESAYA
jgi:carboxylesterase